MLTVTPQAIEKLKEVIDQESGKDAALRVVAVQGDHGSVQYMLTMEKTLQEDDTVMEIDGFKLYMDSYSQPFLDEATIDYVEDLARVGFVVSNPKFSHGGCACGGSGGCACGGNGGCGGH